MKDANGIKKVAAIIEEYSCEPLAVVVSALGKTTNALEYLLKLSLDGEMIQLQKSYFELKSWHLDIVNNLFDNDDKTAKYVEECFRDLWDTLNQKYPDQYFAYDQVVCFGEKLSALIVSQWLTEKNIAVKNIDAEKIIVTNSNFTNAGINWKYTTKAIEALIIPTLDSQQIVVTQGFIGADEYGNCTTLGREGSDFTAAIIANVLNADELTIWKDVAGLMNADPKRFDNAVKLNNISYHEAIELAFYGASIIHPKTIQPLKEKNILLNVKSFVSPSLKASVISANNKNDEDIHKIIVKDNQVLLSITSKNLDFISEDKLTIIFNAFSKNKIHINLMQNSAVSFSVCFNYEAEKLKSLTKEIELLFDMRYNTGLQLITIRHYTNEIIEGIIKGKKVFLEQKSRNTAQFLLKA